MYRRPTFKDVLRAKNLIAPYLEKTPLLQYPSLSELLGCEVYVKHENMLPTGAFKVRGGINLVSQLSAEEKERGVIAVSTGNHGQSIAYASRLFGVKAVICVPDGANPDKVAAIKRFGAEIVEWGKEYDDAKENAERLAEEKGLRYIHSGNEPLLIAGVGTIGLEILEDLPEVDVVIAPVAAGTQASGVAIVMKAASADIQVIGVQAENAPGTYLSWKSGDLVTTDSASTIADGLALRGGFRLPVDIMRNLLDDFVLVSEDELRNAIRLYVEKAHTVAEAAGAASLAAGIKIKDRLKGKKVVFVLSGGNITAEMLREIL
ncbi:MAG: threonine/serine dehydratase [Candidatus Bathyarchaeota archaeon]|nr:MAG: threonine/serine dehydratase [Candidatus Bathyarchaeota archaeon]